MATAADKPKFVMEELKKKAELSSEEAAFYLGIAKQTLYNWKNEKNPKQRPRGRRDHRGKLLFLRVELDRYAKENSKAA